MHSNQPKREDLNQNPSKHITLDTLSSDPNIDSELEERLNDEPDSMGVDIDGTNPGNNSHQ